MCVSESDRNEDMYTCIIERLCVYIHGKTFDNT